MVVSKNQYEVDPPFRPGVDHGRNDPPSFRKLAGPLLSIHPPSFYLGYRGMYNDVYAREVRTALPSL